jgi:hypothetical protein
MENPHGLAGPRVHRHGGRQVVISHLDEFDAEMFHKGVSHQFIDYF